jgi:AAA domain
MGLVIKAAEKHRQWAHICFWGPPKAGKTHSALAIATAIVGPGGKVGVVSSEFGSSALLSKKFPHDIIDLTVDEYGNKVAKPFTPERYEEAIKLFIENGYGAVVIDSLSHAWEAEGGVLERVNSTKNSFSDGWGDVGTPLYKHLVNTILSAPVHTFVTLRAKDGYVMEANDKGRQVPRNVGLKPVIRSSFGYEMQLTIRMDRHVGHIDESAFQDEFPQGAEIINPEDVAYALLECLDGTPVPEPSAQQAEMRKLLDAFYATSPATYARYANWEAMALRKALGLESGPLPLDYSDEQVGLMRAYVESKKAPKQKSA